LASVPIDQLHAILDETSAVFRADLNEEAQANFRDKTKTYVRLYVFLSQIVQFENPYLERLYIFLNHLQSKLGSGEVEIPIDILENINMDSYRLQLEATTNIELEQGDDLQPIPTEMRGGTSDPETDFLSSILQTFNEKYGTEFTEFDKVRQMVENLAPDIAKNQDVIDAIIHTPSTARITSDKVVGEEILKHITSNFDLYKMYSDNKEFREDFSAMMFGVVKEILNTATSTNV
jgi:type I restriction enzyme R subunit